MRFGILGETRALRRDGAVVALGGAVRRAVFALLLLDAGRAVPVERLVDGVYGTEPPAGAVNAVQAQVSRLRAVLDEPIERHPGGYRFAVDPDEVDVHRFERLAGLGRAALGAGDPVRAAGLLREALAVWRGPALADVGAAPFAAGQVARIEESRLAALEDRVAADLALGAHRELVPELRDLVAANPLRERLRAQLMHALHGAGQGAEALAVYEEARRTLAEDLGADPGPELNRAHLAVLRADPVPDKPARHGLPAQLGGFVGRADELAAIERWLATERLVTLIGPGGAGKTRLSVEAAGRHPGEVCFVGLSGASDGAEVPQTLLGALGVRDASRMTGSRDTRDPVARLTAVLADRPTLLVLDNCEHLVEDVASLVARLLADCPGLRVLATSREALGITGEVLCAVTPLPLPPPGTDAQVARDFPAVRLFLQRAAAVRPDAVRDGDLAAVLRVCEALDGLPLAIELAAARLRSLSAADIAARLSALPSARDQRFQLLSRGSRTAQPRQRTLRAVVDWSWQLLTEPERAVLRRAAVFAGGWTLAAAEAVCADPTAGAEAGIEAADVLDLTESLVDKSLVVADRSDGSDSVRYRMLETIRAYCAERLEAAGEAGAVRRAHSGYFGELATAAEPHLRGARQLHWLARIRAEHDNLHTALRRAVADGDTTTALRFFGGLSTYWALRGMRYEGAAPARQVLAALSPNPPAGLAEEYALCVLAAASDGSDAEGLAPHLAAARKVAGRGGPLPRRYPVLMLLWGTYEGVPTGSVPLEPAEPSDVWSGALMRLGAGVQLWLTQAELVGGAAEMDRALTDFRTLGDRWGMAMALSWRAFLAAFQDEPRRAIELFDQALALSAELDADQEMVEELALRSESLARVGEFEAADAGFRRAAELARSMGALEALAAAHRGLGESAWLRGEYGEARRLCELALRECPAGGFAGELARADTLVVLARTAVAEGDAETARGHLAEVSGSALRVLPVAVRVAQARAALALLDGAAEHAARLLGVVDGMCGSAHEPQLADAARASLGAPAYAAAYATGASLDRTTALAVLTGASWPP
ncbi:BTAD domain-containing putative transcriptional regulator [Streptantibioticus rubrisoli]|uniref:AfsR family transcriptional regulator n=1 Tax=Streptantibioticus rubrisoli TaxID=1387313 RepID=A0ABT1PCI5_9ACTN|nr:BTAD domain-containing putative transcriptional regulator [Streptantibioticus rubrisoli]MCQ4042168.1 AfsR family transcriptional regulator [Streptantibioticus rubrisoli]